MEKFFFEARTHTEEGTKNYTNTHTPVQTISVSSKLTFNTSKNQINRKKKLFFLLIYSLQYLQKAYLIERNSHSWPPICFFAKK
jgi:hypothetical protein